MAEPSDATEIDVNSDDDWDKVVGEEDPEENTKATRRFYSITHCRKDPDVIGCYDVEDWRLVANLLPGKVLIGSGARIQRHKTMEDAIDHFYTTHKSKKPGLKPIFHTIRKAVS